MKTNILILILIYILFQGCSKMQIDDFKNSTPKIIPQEYFNGKLTAYGMVKNRSGQIIKTFKGSIIGSWDENGIGTLNEEFVYSDNITQKRVWKLKPTGDMTFDATANDVVGVSKMIVKGNTIVLDYTMTIPYNNSTININVKDWLHLQEDGVILNHSKMKKFGFIVGELVITIIKDYP
jgi:hypothetical protein